MGIAYTSKCLDYTIYGKSEQKVLPADYTQVEYIENTGTQYIDTGVYSDIKNYISFDLHRQSADDCSLRAYRA